MKRDRPTDARKKRLGLLPDGIRRRQIEAASDDNRPAGRDYPPPGTTEHPQPQEPNKTDPTLDDEADKIWKQPCVFSCVPYGWKPVDVYEVVTVTAESPPE